MDWNVVITVQEHGFKKAREFLYEFGKVSKTDFFNVLIMQVDDIDRFLDDVRVAISVSPNIVNILARIMPVTHTFVFQSPQQFEERAKAIVAEWIPVLSSKRFHVRMHRRGFKGRMSSQDEEIFLDRFIIDSLEEQSKPAASIDFEDPDYIIAVDTIGQKAGLSIWTREQLHRYPFLKMD